MLEAPTPTPEDTGLSREYLDISPREEDSVVTEEVEENEPLAEVVELFPKEVETAFIKELEGIEKSPNADGWFKKIGNLSKGAKTFFAGEVAVSSISALFASGMILETAEALSQNRKLDVAVFGMVSAIAAITAFGSGVRARRYGTVENPEKLSFAENEAQ